MYSDIPKHYTAIAEWLSVLVFYLSTGKRSWKNSVMMGLLLPVLIILQIEIGKARIVFWIPGMLIAFLLMIVCMSFTSTVKLSGILNCWCAAFLMAEFVAAFEWQIESYLVDQGFAIRPPMLLAIGMYALFYVLVFFCYRRYYTAEILNEETRANALLAVLGALLFWGLSNLSYVYPGTPFSLSASLSEKTAIFYIRSLVDLCGVMFLLLNQIRSREVYLSKELIMTESIYQTQLKQYELSKINIDMLNRRYHDMKHQIRAIRHETNVEKKDSELKSIEEELKRFEAQSKTGNVILDTIITEKRLYCAEHKIVMNCVIEGELLNNYDTVDICTIFGNALDNAIECEEKNEEDKRFIRVQMSERSGFIIINIENYCEETLEIINGNVRTNKKDSFFHGYGMRSIREIAQKNNGGMTFSQEDNWVSLRILLPKK